VQHILSKVKPPALFKIRYRCHRKILNTTAPSTTVRLTFLNKKSAGY
jgi:hypothetical protein